MFGPGRGSRCNQKGTHEKGPTVCHPFLCEVVRLACRVIQRVRDGTAFPEFSWRESQSKCPYSQLRLGQPERLNANPSGRASGPKNEIDLIQRSVEDFQTRLRFPLYE